ncbi:MAG: SDR family oxidoreductase [Sphingobacteriales bacterium]|nr:MAG: SDR family oxidoreductase [Sphingobacteriales bacterium]
MDFKGKNILVTGGGGVGVGAGVCAVLSRLGATVILNELRLEDAITAAKKYPDTIPVAADIRKEEEITAMFADIKDKVGILHGLVNNAGIGLSKLSHEATESEFMRLYDTDIKGVWQVSKAFVNQLLAAKQPGNIVNISSVHTYATIAKYALYASCKSAVEGLTKGMAVEVGPHNIRVNAVAPGYVHAEQNYELLRSLTADPHKWVEEVKTDHQALFNEVEPEDCGNVVAFLLSDLSKAVTGQTIYTDNGSIHLLYNRSFTEKK